jgi:hypothetical protein
MYKYSLSMYLFVVKCRQIQYNCTLVQIKMCMNIELKTEEVVQTVHLNIFT